MTSATDMPEASDACAVRAAALNRDCACLSIDRAALDEALAWGGPLPAGLLEGRPHLFADSVVFVGERHRAAMAGFIAAVERVVHHPAYIETVLAHAPAIARHDPRTPGVFAGFDFHIAASGPKLIEINTNAGGGLLNARLQRAQRACCPAVAELLAGVRAEQGSAPSVEDRFWAMFLAEWQAVRASERPHRIVIVDTAPATQYLAPEFELFQRFFSARGVAAGIADPAELCWVDGALHWRGEVVDLVYNRLTDFALEDSAHAALRAAYLADAVVLTPHPRAHALYADKRNLACLGDDAWLAEIGIDAATRAALAACLPHTVLVRPDDADTLWQNRRRWFFKPASGFGSRATYRGDKLTRRVFEEILAGNYIAQEYVPPSERRVLVDGLAHDLKLDLRNYTHAGSVQLLAARLYQGQTTNFRTPGGGFAATFAVPGHFANQGGD